MNMNDFRTAAYQKNNLDKDTENDKNKNKKNIKNQQDFINSLPKFQNFPEQNKTQTDSLSNSNKSTGASTSTVTGASIRSDKNQEYAEFLKENEKKQNFLQNKVQKEVKSEQLNKAADYLKSGGLIKVPVEKPEENGKDSVYRRVAKFLLLIGEEEAAKILPHLPENQIEKIIPEIASIRTVTDEEAVVILEEFNVLAKQTKTQGGLETAREMLEKAYGKNRAAQLLHKAVPDDGKIPFEYLQDADNERIYLLLKDENIGVQSMVLSRLQPKKAAGIISLMKSDEKKQLALRLAKMQSIDSEIIRRVDQAMYEKFQNQIVEKAENIDGRNALAQILKKMDVNAERDIIATLETEDHDLGEDIKNRLFTFDDVVNCDDRYIQRWLRDNSVEDIAYLISGKNDDFREKILKNVSQNRGNEILEQEDILKPMQKSICNDITNGFITDLRKAFEKGELIVNGRNQDQYV